MTKVMEIHYIFLGFLMYGGLTVKQLEIWLCSCKVRRGKIFLGIIYNIGYLLPPL